MATQLAPVPQATTHAVEREERGWTSWITTTDHKRIGIMYIVTTFVFFLLGGVEAVEGIGALLRRQRRRGAALHLGRHPVGRE